jgi:membrane-anchored protein YejM (alkaline phosphatase superfamily)
MKAKGVRDIKKELIHRDREELSELLLHLAKFKKENKEFLTYLLFEVSDEAAFIEGVKEEMVDEFEDINTASYYYMKKSVRKILRRVKKHIRFSKKKKTEIELLIFFCAQMEDLSPDIRGSVALFNIYKRQIAKVKKVIKSLHEDLQYDYELELEQLKMSNASH